MSACVIPFKLPRYKVEGNLTYLHIRKLSIAEIKKHEYICKKNIEAAATLPKAFENGYHGENHLLEYELSLKIPVIIPRKLLCNYTIQQNI